MNSSIMVELFQKLYHNHSWLAHLQLSILDNICHKGLISLLRLKDYHRDWKAQPLLILSKEIELEFRLLEVLHKELTDNIKLHKIMLWLQQIEVEFLRETLTVKAH
jgi:hypothetical protein